MKSSSFGSPSFTPPNSVIPSRISFAKPSPSGRRATPTTANCCGKRPACCRWNSAGSSFLFVRSPEAPKITTTVGSGVRSFDRRSFRVVKSTCACVTAAAIASSSCSRVLPCSRYSGPLVLSFRPSSLHNVQTNRTQCIFQRLLALVLNCMQPHLRRGRAVRIAIINKHTLLRLEVQQRHSGTEHARLRLAHAKVRRAEKSIEELGEPEGLNAVIVQRSGLVVQHCHLQPAALTNTSNDVSRAPRQPFRLLAQRLKELRRRKAALFEEDGLL